MIALSHGGTTTYSSTAFSQELVVGTADGVVFLQRSAGGAWEVSRRALDGRHISALLVPEPGLIVAGAFHDAVHVSTDGGRSWTRRGEGLVPSNVYSLLAVARGRGHRIYAGTQPAHLFCSDNLGVTWTELRGLREVPGVSTWSFPAPPHEAHVKHIVADPHDPAGLYACVEQGALLKSDDAGATWRVLHGVDEDVHFLSVDPRDADALYISGGMGCYSSTDGGKNWRHVTTRSDPIGGYPDTLVRSPAQPQHMFLGVARVGPGEWRVTRRSDTRLCRSLDGGQTWETPATFPRDLVAAIEALALEDCSESMVLFAGTTAGEILASEDRGSTGKTIARGLAPIAKYGHERALLGK